MMKTAQDIIIAPVITEASMAAIAQKKYTFRVMKKVNKQEIAAAVEELFGVKVAKVNTINVRGRSKRMGLHSGKTADWKKAIVTLKADSKGIEFFESMLEGGRNRWLLSSITPLLPVVAICPPLIILDCLR